MSTTAPTTTRPTAPMCMGCGDENATLDMLHQCTTCAAKRKARNSRVMGMLAAKDAKGHADVIGHLRAAGIK